MNPRFESIELDLRPLGGSGMLRGIRHRDPAAPADVRLLCLHGWLDNAASFVPLMPFLPAIDLVALDLPGHGHSDHEPGGYSLFEMALAARRAMRTLGWERCHLAGHSLGGNVAPYLAAAAPAEIERLIMIEAAGPLAEEAEALPARLGRAMADRLEPGRYASRLFPTRQAAVESRLKVARMDSASARLIIDRQLVTADDGFRWRFDPALRYASPEYRTEAQVRAVLCAPELPTLVVLAKDGYPLPRAETAARLTCIAKLELVELAGHHHLHMDTPEPVAAAINRFLGTRPAPGG